MSAPVRASGEMADALASGASDRKVVGVQVPPRAQMIFMPGSIQNREAHKFVRSCTANGH